MTNKTEINRLQI